MTRMVESFSIKDVQFRSRVFRSSMGGRTAYYDGTASRAWKNFEVHFARPQNRLGAIISATIGVDEDRLSPLEYPKISHKRVLPALREGVQAVQAEGCRYIMQIGDPGAHTQMSLLPQAADGKSASSGFDLVYGYRNRSSGMTIEEVRAEVAKFAEAAARVREIGCDGLEITASKGYIIHQFLNPATNRRSDAYGQDRFLLLREIVEKAREATGSDRDRKFLLGIRLSAKDCNWLPINIRWPMFPLRDCFIGNGLEQTLAFGRKLKDLKVDYLHIDAGFGFLNPLGSPGEYPLEGVRLFANATRHLSAKARARAMLLNAMPAPVARAVFGFGWKERRPPSADFAARFRRELGLPVIANGGFQARTDIEDALKSCDAVAIARPLLANADLVEQLQHAEQPRVRCSFCSLCCTRTAVQPLGCYDLNRFRKSDGDDAAMRRMEAEILRLSADSS
jgi:2,4-dienoyl-CoA reductase-like NADH-dependent reductase (Old Yellow Enzyme family)